MDRKLLNGAVPGAAI